MRPRSKSALPFFAPNQAALDFFTPARGARQASRSAKQPLAADEAKLKPTATARAAARNAAAPVASTSTAPAPAATPLAPSPLVDPETIALDRLFAMHRPLLEITTPVDAHGLRRSATHLAHGAPELPLPLPYSSDPNHPRSITNDDDAANDWEDEIRQPYWDPHDSYLVGSPGGADADWVDGTSRHLAGLEAHVPPAPAASPSHGAPQFSAETLSQIAFLAPFGLAAQSSLAASLAPAQPPPLPKIRQDDETLGTLATRFLGRQQARRAWFDQLRTLRVLDELDGMVGRERSSERLQTLREATQAVRRRRARIAAMKERQRRRGVSPAPAVEAPKNMIAAALDSFHPRPRGPPTFVYIVRSDHQPTMDEIGAVLKAHMRFQAGAKDDNGSAASYGISVQSVQLDSVRRKRISKMKCVQAILRASLTRTRKKKRKKVLRSLARAKTTTKK